MWPLSFARGVGRRVPRRTTRARHRTTGTVPFPRAVPARFRAATSAPVERGRHSARDRPCTGNRAGVRRRRRWTLSPARYFNGIATRASTNRNVPTTYAITLNRVSRPRRAGATRLRRVTGRLHRRSSVAPLSGARRSRLCDVERRRPVMPRTPRPPVQRREVAVVGGEVGILGVAARHPAIPSHRAVSPVRAAHGAAPRRERRSRPSSVAVTAGLRAPRSVPGTPQRHHRRPDGSRLPTGRPARTRITEQLPPQVDGERREERPLKRVAEVLPAAGGVTRSGPAATTPGTGRRRRRATTRTVNAIHRGVSSRVPTARPERGSVSRSTSTVAVRHGLGSAPSRRAPRCSAAPPRRR